MDINLLTLKEIEAAGQISVTFDAPIDEHDDTPYETAIIFVRQESAELFRALDYAGDKSVPDFMTPGDVLGFLKRWAPKVYDWDLEALQ